MSQKVHLHHGRKSNVNITDNRITANSDCGPTAVDENDSTSRVDGNRTIQEIAGIRSAGHRERAGDSAVGIDDEYSFRIQVRE